MIKSKKTRVLPLALSLAVACLSVVSGTPVVQAEPSSSQLESQTSDLQNQLDDLNGQLSSLATQLDSTSSSVEELAAQVEKSKLDLAAARLNESLQYDAMKDRIKFIYEGGNVSLLQILFSSENMSDFLNKAEYVSSISEYDRDMLKELKAVRDTVQKKQEELEKRQKDLTVLQEDLKAKREALTSQISSTSTELSDYQAQLERAKAAEAALQAAKDREKVAQIQVPASSQPAADVVSTVEPMPYPDTSDLVLFAAILEAEAGGNADGLLAVATVIMNRVSSPRFPNTLSEVIYQSGQFAPTWDGNLQRILAKGPSALAYSTAQAALAGQRHSAVANCYFFHAAWTGKEGVNVGGNVFW